MVSAAASGPTLGDAAAGIFSGSAFDRVWDIGTPAEKWATIALLSFAVLGSFAFTVVLRRGPRSPSTHSTSLVYFMYSSSLELNSLKRLDRD